ncbi:YjcQ family protein [Helcococcus bovis]|uniref:YjcQ family protein n=1 Tax=Helcococcus bovis TaxID=3153252 RepID=UPI0038BACE94
MAKDDYHVIVYKILAYLYQQLKKGENNEPEMLLNNGGLFNINKTYWLYILQNLIDDGYIKGLNNISVGNGYYIPDQLKYCQITPKGIDYLCQNSTIEKAKNFLKDIKEITPFI